MREGGRSIESSHCLTSNSQTIIRYSKYKKLESKQLRNIRFAIANVQNTRIYTVATEGVLWDVNTGSALTSFKVSDLIAPCFSECGKLLVLAGLAVNYREHGNVSIIRADDGSFVTVLFMPADGRRAIAFTAPHKCRLAIAKPSTQSTLNTKLNVARRYQDGESGVGEVGIDEIESDMSHIELFMPEMAVTSLPLGQVTAPGCSKLLGGIRNPVKLYIISKQLISLP